MGVTVPTLINNLLSGVGRSAVHEAVTDLGVPVINVTNILYGADPTGARDSTEAIQKAVDAAAKDGQPGSVEIPAGTFKVSFPFIALRSRVRVWGHGDSTVVFATGDSPAEETGVFHIGTFNKRLEDPGMFRAGLHDLMIKTGDGSIHHQPAITNVSGVVLNTDLGNGPTEPDATHTISGLTIWDMHTGMAILGKDDQGCKIMNVRIRGAQAAGLQVGKHPEHPEMLDGSQGSNPGGADNHFLNMDVSSANKIEGGNRAGIEIYSGNGLYMGCKSWYNKRWNALEADPNILNADRSATLTAIRDGAGFYIRGGKSRFVSCESQESAGHGFILINPGNNLTGCTAESSGFYDSVKGNAKVNETNGFMILNGARYTALTNCHAFNGRTKHKDQAYGYWIEKYASFVTVRGTAQDNALGEVKLGASLASTVRVEVNETTLNLGETEEASTGEGGEIKAIEPLLPPQLPGYFIDLHFMDEDVNTPLATGYANRGSDSLITFKQSDRDKTPTTAVLGGHVAVKFSRVKGDNLFLEKLPRDSTAANGYTISWTGSINSTVAKGTIRYLFASLGVGAKNPLSVGLTDTGEVRVVANGSSAGLVATTDGAKLGLFEPVTIVIRVANNTLTVWANKTKVVTTGDDAHKAGDLTGKFVLGSYSDGTNTTDATVGELGIFSEPLTDEQVASLQRGLSQRWK